MLAAVRRSLGVALLCLAVLLGGGWSLRPSSPSPDPAVPAGGLREVAPPAGTQQLRQALRAHEPRLRILAPANDAVLPAGAWTLELAVTDWPLVDAGELGLGSHLVVQLDQSAPVRIGATGDGPADLRSGAGTQEAGLEQQLTVPMPPLTPGSHRLTVYAARPWGEAVKDPGAWEQIRLHRVAPNPTTQPAPDTPQLISTTPSDLVLAEPVLIDWLLVDAPLQQLSADDRRWRLRISLNGDSFLVDHQTPIWLKGLRNGSNALQLELLDGLGEPLNPPFNSLVQELQLVPGGARVWQNGPLDADNRDRLLGLPPAATAAPAPAAVTLEPVELEPMPAGSEPEESGEPAPAKQEEAGRQQEAVQQQQEEEEEEEPAGASADATPAATAPDPTGMP